MSKLVNAGQVTLPTGTGGVTWDVGFAPKAVMFFISGVATFNGISSLHQSWGVIAGATKRYRSTWAWVSNASASEARHRRGESHVAFYNGFAIDASISVNSVTLTPGGSLTQSASVTWFAVGGGDVEVAVRSTTVPNGVTTISDCGFDPTCVFFGSGINVAVDTTGFNRGDVVFGVLISGTSRASGLSFSQESAVSSTGSRWMTDRAVNYMNNSTPRQFYTAAITPSLVTGGFSLNSAISDTGHKWALCVRGLSVALLSSQLPTAAGDVDLTGAGFTPNSAIAFATPDNTADDTNQTATTSVAYGVAIRDGDQGSASIIGGFDTGRTGVARSSSTRGLVTLEKTGVNTYVDEADATVSFLSDGARFAFNAPHNAAGRFAVLLTNGGLPASGPAFRSYYITG